MGNSNIGSLPSVALVLGLVMSGFAGCNQQRYQPAEWRVAPRTSSAAVDEKSDENSTAPAAQRFGQLTPWLDSSVLPRDVASTPRWTTLPNRHGNTLPTRNGTTLANRFNTTLPLRNGITLPTGNRLIGNGTTLPNRSGILSPNRSGQTLPSRNGTTLPDRNGMTLPK